MAIIKHYRILLGIILIVVLLQSLHPSIAPIVSYQRDNILAGEWWRLLTGHFIHLSWMHLAINLAGLALIWRLSERVLTNGQWLVTLFGCALVCGLLLLLLAPQLSWYVGLSGVLHGALVVSALQQIRAKQSLGWLLLLFVVAKIGWEQWAGASAALAAQIGGNVIIDAHLYGAIAGSIIASLLLLSSQLAANLKR